jgi:hypothetical protein
VVAGVVFLGDLAFPGSSARNWAAAYFVTIRLDQISCNGTRFRRVVEENPGQPFYIPELCKAIGVSERTLRVCCQEQLGVGPARR